MHPLRRRRRNEDEVAVALEQFGPVWESLTPREQTRLVQRLIEKVEHDGQAGTVAITFHAAGIKMLADEILAPQHNDPKEKRA
jgi:site-specific DNA recombinase